MSKRDNPSGPLPTLEPETTPLRVVPAWRLVTPEPGESCRWECYDGRWVRVRIGTEEDLGVVFVEDSRGRQQRLHSYEAALELARLWRGPVDPTEG